MYGKHTRFRRSHKSLKYFMDLTEEECFSRMRSAIADVFLTSAPECRRSRSARQQILSKRMQLDWETSSPHKHHPTSQVESSSTLHVAQLGGPPGVKSYLREAIASCASSMCFRFYGAFEDSTTIPSCERKRCQTNHNAMSAGARTWHTRERSSCPLLDNLASSWHFT